MGEISKIIFELMIIAFGAILYYKFEKMTKDVSEIKQKTTNIEKIVHSMGSKYLDEWKDREIKKIVEEEKKNQK